MESLKLIGFQGHQSLDVDTLICKFLAAAPYAHYTESSLVTVDAIIYAKTHRPWLKNYLVTTDMNLTTGQSRNSNESGDYPPPRLQVDGAPSDPNQGITLTLA